MERTHCRFCSSFRTVYSCGQVALVPGSDGAEVCREMSSCAARAANSPLPVPPSAASPAPALVVTFRKSRRLTSHCFDMARPRIAVSCVTLDLIRGQRRIEFGRRSVSSTDWQAAASIVLLAEIAEILAPVGLIATTIGGVTVRPGRISGRRGNPVTARRDDWSKRWPACRDTWRGRPGTGGE